MGLLEELWRNGAARIAMLTPERLYVSFLLAVILAYYLLAALLPIDKLIGKGEL